MNKVIQHPAKLISSTLYAHHKKLNLLSIVVSLIDAVMLDICRYASHIRSQICLFLQDNISNSFGSSDIGSMMVLQQQYVHLFYLAM